MTFSLSDANTATMALCGNQIHEVTFDGCEKRSFKGVQDPSRQFEVLEIKFSNRNGTFTHTIWEPREADFEDRDGAYGKEPANALAMVYLVKHLIDAVNPAAADKINKGELNIDINPNNWSQFCDFIVEHTKAGIGTTTKIKLLNNKKGEASFPAFFLRYDRNGKPRMSTSFIGSGIYFTTKELDRMKQVSEAKPSEINDLDVTTKTEDDSEFNYDL
jgi:hypothetical protein